MASHVTYAYIRQNPDIREYIRRADMSLAAIGYTEHSFAHVEKAAHNAAMILETLNYPPPVDEICSIISAIGNHDEGTAQPVDAISAALIIADKTDVRRSRVRNTDFMTFDIHDRVNYAVEYSNLHFSEDKKSLVLDLTIDTEISSVLEYFEIFMERMLLSKRAALFFDKKFKMYINGSSIL